MLSSYYTRHRRTSGNIFLLHKTQENRLYYLPIAQDRGEPLIISHYSTRHRRTIYNIFLFHKTQEKHLYYLPITQDTGEPVILSSYYTRHRRTDSISGFPASCVIGRYYKSFSCVLCNRKIV
jgi:hypothetical protein